MFKVPLLIRILDADDELAVVMAGKQIVEQCGTGVPDMQVTGWAWCITYADFLCHMKYPLFCKAVCIVLASLFDAFL